MEGTIGEIRMFAGNFAPRTWAFCHGQLLPINANAALFSILGTTYGGDGRTTFALPELRGRVALGVGNGPGLSDSRLGERKGTETVTLNVAQLPAHTHTASGTVTPAALSVEGDSATPAAAVPAKSGQGEPDYDTGEGDTTMRPNDVTVSVDNTGGGQPHTNLQPSLGLNFIICLQGVFPSRN